MTDMHGMFYGMTSFYDDISEWDVSRVTDMYGVFLGAEVGCVKRD